MTIINDVVKGASSVLPKIPGVESATKIMREGGDNETDFACRALISLVKNADLKSLTYEKLDSAYKHIAKVVIDGCCYDDSVRECARRALNILARRRKNVAVRARSSKPTTTETPRAMTVKVKTTKNRPPMGLEVGFAGSFGAQVNSSSRLFSGGAFVRYGFRPNKMLNPFVMLEGNGGHIDGNNSLNYGGIQAGGGLRVAWGKLTWAYSLLSFMAGPVFTDQGAQAQLSLGTAIGIKIPISTKITVLLDLLSINYKNMIKSTSDMKHHVSAQARVALRF